MAHCDGCGGEEALRVTTKFTAQGRFESCDRCDGIGAGTSVPVDAAGQPISFPEGGFYSVAIGDRWWGNKRDFVNHIKEHGLVGRPDIAMGRKNHDGLRNAPNNRHRR